MYKLVCKQKQSGSCDCSGFRSLGAQCPLKKFLEGCSSDNEPLDEMLISHFTALLVEDQEVSSRDTSSEREESGRPKKKSRDKSPKREESGRPTKKSRDKSPEREESERLTKKSRDTSPEREESGRPTKKPRTDKDLLNSNYTRPVGVPGPSAPPPTVSGSRAPVADLDSDQSSSDDSTESIGVWYHYDGYKKSRVVDILSPDKGPISRKVFDSQMNMISCTNTRKICLQYKTGEDCSSLSREETVNSSGSETDPMEQSDDVACCPIFFNIERMCCKALEKEEYIVGEIECAIADKVFNKSESVKTVCAVLNPLYKDYLKNHRRGVKRSFNS